MEHIIKKQSLMANSTTPTSLSMHRDSQTISKAANNNNTKPKIRIIHIFAPEIIKTDAANFRELVQRLTGKPTANDVSRRFCKKKKKKKLRASTMIRREEPTTTRSVVLCDNMMRTATATANVGGFFGLGTRERVKEEEEEEEEAEEEEEDEEEGAEIWNGANNGGFLNGFADFDGFIQELGEFPLMPLPDSALIT